MIKRGFSIMELLFVLIVSIIGTAYYLSNVKYEAFDNELSNMMTQINSILIYGVTDPYLGYISQKDATYCSPDGYYTNLTAYRTSGCTSLATTININSTEVLLEADKIDYTKSYFQWLKGFGINGDGCKGYLMNEITTPREFKLYLDCSDVDSTQFYGQGLEQSISDKIRIMLPGVLKSINRSVDKLNDFNDSNGTMTDNKVLFTFAK